MRAGRLTIAAAVAALALGGVALAASTPAKYRTQAGAICTATNKALNKVAKPVKPSGIEAFLRKDLVIFDAQLRKLVRLTPPRSLKTLHLKALGLERRELAAIRQLADKIHGGMAPEVAFNSLSKKLNGLAKSESATWKKLGIKSCSEQ